MTAVTPRRVAYVTSRFPKLSESFVSNEIVAVKEQGLDVELYALVHETEETAHPEARELAAQAHFPEWGQVMRDQFWWVRHAPRRYLAAWRRAVVGNLPSPKFLARAVVVVPVAASFARSVQRGGVEHIHAHWATHSGLAAYVMHLLTGVPYSITAHAHEIHVDRTMLEEKLSNASAVVTISDFNRNELERFYGTDLVSKVEVIRCGVDPTVFDPPTRSDDGCLDIVMVASLERRKGHDVLFDACRRLVADGIDLSVTVVGDGEERDRLAARITALGLDGRIRLVGPQPRPGVVDALARADVFVLPSITLESGKMEGIPVALMEAMAMGLPVVSTRMSGIPELIDDGVHGFLTDEGSVEQLAGALASLARDPELRDRMGAAGRDRVTDEYSLSTNATRLIGLFASGAGSRGA